MSFTNGSGFGRNVTLKRLDQKEDVVRCECVCEGGCACGSVLGLTTIILLRLGGVPNK